MLDIWVTLWLGGLAVLFGVFTYVEKAAAMRGSKRNPLPTWTDKGLRLFFFWTLVAPLCFLAPWIVVPLSLLYLPSFLDGTEKFHGRPSPWMKSLGLWGWFRRRLDLQLIRTVELDPNKLYIFGIHPHGILPFGGIMNFATEVNNVTRLLPGLRLRQLAASFVFYIPGYRDMMLAGGVCDAARYVARRLLDDGLSLVLVPGGATEALYATPRSYTLVLRKRQGFVKLALETGAQLVPVFSFGENDTYHQLSADNRFVAWAKLKFQRIFGISLPLITNIIPLKCKVTTVIGAPLKVTKVEKPSHDQIEALLEQYVQAVTKLFLEHKDKYLPDQNATIKVI